MAENVFDTILRVFEEGKGAGCNSISKEETTKIADMSSVFAMLRDEVLDADVSNEEKVKMLQKVYKLSTTKTNLMIVGATGVGKAQPSTRCLTWTGSPRRRKAAQNPHLTRLPRLASTYLPKRWRLTVTTSAI